MRCFTIHVNSLNAMTVGHCSTQLGLWDAASPSPPADPGQHPGGGPGGEAPGNLRNLAFSGYQIEAKHRFHSTYLTVTCCLQFTSHGNALDHNSHELNL